jgi:PTS system fructose-specific IIA component/PTS system nitrogen regulatory IIA component
MDSFASFDRAAAELGFLVADLPPAADPGKEPTLRYLVGRLVEGGLLAEGKVEDVVRALLRREGLGSTGIGEGVAIPHCKTEAVSRLVGVVGHSAAGIDWQSVDGQPARRISLVLSPPAGAGDFLRALERLAHTVRRRGQ